MNCGTGISSAWWIPPFLYAKVFPLWRLKIKCYPIKPDYFSSSSVVFCFCLRGFLLHIPGVLEANDCLDSNSLVLRLYVCATSPDLSFSSTLNGIIVHYFSKAPNSFHPWYPCLSSLFLSPCLSLSPLSPIFFTYTSLHLFCFCHSPILFLSQGVTFCFLLRLLFNLPLILPPPSPFSLIVYFKSI